MQNKKQTQRSVWWRLHQLAGLQVSLYMFFVLMTGTLAVVSHEIDWLLRPQMWVSPVQVEERVSWGAVSRAVAEHAPDSTMINLYAPLHSAATFDVIVQRDEQLRHIYVHPRTGEITGEGSWIGFQRFLRDAHRRLMIFESIGTVRIGIVLVCLSSVYLLITLISSFWIYKKWWKGFFRWPKGRNLRSFTGDLHRWAGLWSLWFVIVITYTGLWYLIEEFTDRPNLSTTKASSGTSTLMPTGDIHAALDQAVILTKQQHPQYEVERVIWPQNPTQDLQIIGSNDRASLVESSANAVWASSENGEIHQWRDPSLFGLHQRVVVANNPLHFGVFAGYFSKIAYFLFGLVLSGLAITGVMIYILRMAKAQKESATWRFSMRTTWQGMGLLRWPALAFTLCSFVLAPFFM